MDYLAKYLRKAQKAMCANKEAANVIAVRTATGKAWDKMSPVARRDAKANFDLLMGYSELISSLVWAYEKLYHVSCVIQDTGNDEAQELAKEVWNIEAALEAMAIRLCDAEYEAEQIVRGQFGVELLDAHYYDLALINDVLISDKDDDAPRGGGVTISTDAATAVRFLAMLKQDKRAA